MSTIKQIRQKRFSLFHVCEMETNAEHTKIKTITCLEILQSLKGPGYVLDLSITNSGDT